MNKLLRAFEKEGAIESKLANIIWKSGMFIVLGFLTISTFHPKLKKVGVLCYIAITIMLYVICEIIYIKKVIRRLGIKCRFKDLFGLEYIQKVYTEIDKYQLKWIKDYCEKNKIKNFNKQEFLVQEIKEEEKEDTIQYINPVILGTLVLTIFSSGIQFDKTEFLNELPIWILVVFFLTLWIEFFKRALSKYNCMLTVFERFSNKKRLKELLEEIIL